MLRRRAGSTAVPRRLPVGVANRHTDHGQHHAGRGTERRIGLETITLSPAQFLKGEKEGPQSLI
jgi:hypothetical protein